MMQNYVDFSTGGQTLALRRMSRFDVQHTAALCDLCVGKNLYSRSYLKSIVNDPNSYFFLLFGPSDTMAGYVFFQHTTFSEMLRFLRTDEAALCRIVPQGSRLVNFRSIGVRPSMRHSRLAQKLLQFSVLFSAAELDAAAMFGAFWRQGDVVPMLPNLEQLGFIHYSTIPMMWYDTPELFCPVCNGRCICSAETYYKKLQEE